MAADHAHAELIALLVLLSGSLLMPVLSGRLRIPSAVLLIIFGVGVGPHGLALIGDSEVVAFLAEVGFIVLMFLAGMEIDFNGLRRMGPRVLVVVTAICLVTFGLAFLVAWALGHTAVYGLALGATSVGLPLAVLKESKRLHSSLGQMIILVGSVGEFLTVIGMTLFYFLARYGVSWQLAIGLGKLLGLLLAAGLTLRILVAIAWWSPQRFSKFVDQDDGSEIGVRAALTLAIAFAVLAVVAGVEAIVGSFVAGALIAFVLRGKEVLEEKLAVVGYGLFVPLFFVVVGLRFDPGVFTWPNLAVALILLAATFLTRLVPSLALIRQGMGPKDLFASVSLLSAPLTLVVAIAAVGRDLGSLDVAGEGTLLLLAVTAGVIYPTLFRIIAGKASKGIGEDSKS